MQIVEKKLAELQPYENNPRKNDAAVPFVANSIKLGIDDVCQESTVDSRIDDVNTFTINANQIDKVVTCMLAGGDDGIGKTASLTSVECALRSVFPAVVLFIVCIR